MNKLKEMKEFLQNKDGWSLDELIQTICYETNLLRINKYTKDVMDVSLDECIIMWGDSDEVGYLDEFIKEYTEIFIEKICNVIDSFDDEVVQLSKEELFGE